MEHVLHRAAPMLLTEVTPKRSFWRFWLGAVLFASVGIGATAIVIIKELALMTIATLFLWGCLSAIATRFRQVPNT
jgi:hypothetical protein